MPALVYRITEVLSAISRGPHPGLGGHGPGTSRGAAGFVVSFVAMRWLLRYISTHDFRPFGVYRIVIGLLIIALVVLGQSL
jgi:bacitracin resistance protein BacA